MHLEKEEERHQGQKHIDPVEFVHDAPAHVDQLHGENERVVNHIARVGFVVLAAREGVDEALDGARIAPLHGRVGHARQGHVEIEGGAEQPGHAAEDHDQPFQPQLARQPGQRQKAGERRQGQDEANGRRTQRAGSRHTGGGEQQITTQLEVAVTSRRLAPDGRETDKHQIRQNRADANDVENHEHRGVLLQAGEDVLPGQD